MITERATFQLLTSGTMLYQWLILYNFVVVFCVRTHDRQTYTGEVGSGDRRQVFFTMIKWMISPLLGWRMLLDWNHPWRISLVVYFWCVWFLLIPSPWQETSFINDTDVRVSRRRVAPCSWWIWRFSNYYRGLFFLPLIYFFTVRWRRSSCES